MKTLMLTLTLFAALSAGANTTTEKSLDSNKNNYAATSRSTTNGSNTLSMEAAMAENMYLKAQLVTLLNEKEELQSMVNYEKMMAGMFLKLNAQKANDKIEDLKATVEFGKLMTNTLLKSQNIR